MIHHLIILPQNKNIHFQKQIVKHILTNKCNNIIIKKEMDQCIHYLMF